MSNLPPTPTPMECIMQYLRDRLAALAYTAQNEGLTDSQYRESAMLLREYRRMLTQEQRYKAAILRGLQQVAERDSGTNDRIRTIKRVM